ncbi:MAG: alpha/beta hydrolase [Chloroflexi bacterium]|nr:alpha/beta hydrolase [Chloroflexota bacterium]
MPKIATASHELFYTHNGVAAEVHLLLVHGAADTHLGWPAELRRLAGVSVYALDLPGHGRSPLPGCASIVNHAAAVADFVAALGLTRVVIMGHSMGGAIAQQLGSEQPAWLAGLVLVATAAHMPVSEAILSQSLTDVPAMAAFVVKYSWSRDAPDWLTERARAAILALEPQVIHDDFVACNAFAGGELVGRIAVPTLIIGGEKDRMTAVAQSQWLHEHIVGSQLVIFPAASHRLTLEQGGEVAAVVSTFLAGLPNP